MVNNNWFSALEKMSNVDYISEEIYIIDTPILLPSLSEVFKSDVTITCICLKGEINMHLNLVPVCAKASGLLIILPEQIIQYDGVSEDFQGIFIIMSKAFTSKINIPESLPTYISIRSAPYLILSEESLKGLLDYCRMLRAVLRNKEEEFNRIAIVNHLTIAFFYGLGYYLHKVINKEKKSRNEIIVEDFLKLVQKHYKQERNLDFYANKLCMTSKYLSTVVKLGSGISAKQWINDYIVLEAKSLLKSTTLTVQQISDEFNFPSQSFFGKFFKREVGISPKQYREVK